MNKYFQVCASELDSVVIGDTRVTVCFFTRRMEITEEKRERASSTSRKRAVHPGEEGMAAAHKSDP